MKYRYRYFGGTSRGAIARFDTVLAKLGRIKYIKGYRYFGRYSTTHEAVLICGEKGTARFQGLCWGYFGEGTRALHGLLFKLGIADETAKQLAFKTPRLAELGEDWRVTFGEATIITTPFAAFAR